MSEEMSSPEVSAEPSVPTGEVSEPTEGLEATEPEGLAEEQLSTLKELLPKYRERVKIGGEERELTYDELIQLAQKGGGADKKFYEADQYKKEAESKIRYYQEFIEGLKQDPFSVIQQNPDLKGLDVRRAAEEYLAAQLREELMSDEERQSFKEKQELEQLRQWREQVTKQQESAQARAAQDEAMQHYDNLFTKALETAQLPKNPHTIARMAAMTKSLLNEGIEDVTSEELAELIREDYEKEVREYAQFLGAEKIPSLLGDDTVKALRKQFAGAVKNPESANLQALRTKGVKRPEKQAKTVREWRQELEALRSSL